MTKLSQEINASVIGDRFAYVRWHACGPGCYSKVVVVDRMWDLSFIRSVRTFRVT